MAIERGTHDLAHAMVWSRHPKVFKAVKALGRKHLENPKDATKYKARDILEEQSSNMVHELKWLMSSDAERWQSNDH